MEQIKIRSFKTVFEAEMARNFLEAQGIKSFFQSTGVHSSGIQSDKNGVDLFVLEKDVEKAREILELPLQ